MLKSKIIMVTKHDIPTVLTFADIELQFVNDYLIYNRKSTDDTQNQKNSLSYQRQRNIEYAHGRKLRIAKLTVPGFCKDGIVDEAHSAFKEEDEFVLLPDGSVQYRILRKKFARLVELLKTKKIKGVIILCWDRGSRNDHDDMLIKRLLKLGCDIRYVDTTYEKTSAGELHQDVDGMFSAHYSRVISEKVRNAHVKLRAERRCLYLSPIGYLDYGSDNKPLDPDRAPKVKQIFELYATEKWSYTGLVTWAHENGLTKKPSRRKRTKEEIADNFDPETLPKIARPIDRKDIEHILKNPFYTGRVKLENGRYDKSKAHQALIDDELFEKVQKMLKKRNQSVYYTEKPFFSCRGLLRCPCGRVFTPYKQKGIVYYRSRCLDTCDNPDPNLSDADIISEIQNVMDKIWFTDDDIARIEARASKELGNISRRRDLKLDSLQSRQRKVLADLDYIAQNRITLMRTAAMAPEDIAVEAERLNALLLNINAEISAYSESAPEMLKFIMRFSELVKDASLYYRFALDNEKREMIMTMFSELVFKERKLVKYTAKEGFGALMLAHGPSGAGGGTRTHTSLRTTDLKSVA